MFARDAYRLCLVLDEKAYFTTRDLSLQTGDDWDDSPYEHNAGEPYSYDPRHDADKEPWDIKVFRIEYDGEIWSPEVLTVSVDSINRGIFPWLVGRFEAIWAGETISGFLDKAAKMEIRVWQEIDPASGREI